MKKNIVSLIATVLVLCHLFTTAAMAAQSVSFPDEGMTLQLPDDFSVVTKENLTEKAELLQEYNVSQTETDVKFNKENYLLLGLSQTMRCTMFLSKQTDSVSVTIGDLISYENQEVARSLILGKELPESVAVKEIERNGALFYRVNFGVTDGIGRVAYITVMNGTAYTLCVVDNSGTLTANINAALDFAFDHWDYTIYAEEGKIRAFKDRIATTVRLICIPLLLALGAWLVYRIFVELRRRRLQEELRRITPKKPRR